MRDVDWLVAPDSFKGSFSAREVALASLRETGDLAALEHAGSVLARTLCST